MTLSKNKTFLLTKPFILIMIFIFAFLAIFLGCFFGINYTVTLEHFFNYPKNALNYYDNPAMYYQSAKENNSTKLYNKVRQNSRYYAYIPSRVDSVHPILSEPYVLNDYTFLGWFQDYSCTIPWVDGTKISHNITLYAKWETKCKVRLNFSNLHNVTNIGNDREEAVQSVYYVDKGERFNITKKYRAEYKNDKGEDDYDIISHWFLDKDLTIRWDGGIVNEDIVLFPLKGNFIIREK